MEQKTFYKALLDINIDPTKTKKCLQDKRLTHIEKRIIEGFLLIRNNQNQEAFNLMNSLPTSELPFVDAFKHFLMGVSLNNQSLFPRAENSILKALPVLEELNCDYFTFMGHFNLSFIYLNTSQLEKMQSAIGAMDQIKTENDLQVLRLLRCKFAFYSESNDEENAKKSLEELKKYEDQMPESDAISQLLCEFRFFVSQENFKKCHDLLNEMKNFRKFHLTENFNYMKKLLNHLTENSPLYAYGNEFDSIPILKHQIAVIKFLEEQNRDEANLEWKKLQELAPKMFLDDFVFRGKKCLFSICLNKHNQRKKQFQVVKKEDQTQIDTLINLLINSGKPLPKGLIYEILWDESPIEKDDLKKLSRLVHRARVERGIDIISRKGTYFAGAKVKKKKVS